MKKCKEEGEMREKLEVGKEKKEKNKRRSLIQMVKVGMQVV